MLKEFRTELANVGAAKLRDGTICQEDSYCGFIYLKDSHPMYYIGDYTRDDDDMMNLAHEVLRITCPDMPFPELTYAYYMNLVVPMYDTNKRPPDENTYLVLGFDTQHLRDNRALAAEPYVGIARKELHYAADRLDELVAIITKNQSAGRLGDWVERVAHESDYCKHLIQPTMRVSGREP